ncbi:MAG: arsenosugar biosynthesis radical SAM protein ArsS [Sedimenticola sp.]|nr:arsenosugar biosynthesis radical SAM protein ArsS [Sedimenticola sp.]MCW8947497.1 arsenosugar biosynthesis radical SAM protein ArsS [Sedimenticola sp.]MCW8976035.1 arsenosugar biosynthesis radical SAM protein ArsS [Sedimenticola sp.]MDF1529686.1 arsenosugar biosynthesis radical SAM protein ArsS [Sedimenticola sp.]
MLDTVHLLSPTTFPSITRGRLETLQINLGYRCNQTCKHCHVNAGPGRTEMMDEGTVNQILRFIQCQQIKTIDLTGGAPEMNPYFSYLVESARAMGVRVLDRCNLSILEEPGHEQLAAFLAEQSVEVVASLPCYLQENVDEQRGKGVYDASIRGLKLLNSFGYGKQGSGLTLNLVYNPLGPALPPPQDVLEADYKKRLMDDHGIVFNQLFTITNMPISRFGSTLLSKGEFAGYMDMLKGAYSSDNLQTVMCRNLLSVDWQGYLYDCDFNQMLQMPIVHKQRAQTHITDIMNESLDGEPIRIAEHCYGCTAGQGSSCGGALSD